MRANEESTPQGRPIRVAIAKKKTQKGKKSLGLICASEIFRKRQ